MRYVIVAIMLLFVSGCASSGHRSLPMNPSTYEAVVFLDTITNHESRVNVFVNKNPNATELQKMVFLLRSISDSNLIFIRNGRQYNSKKAMKWLSWKSRHHQYYKHPIVSAWDFVLRVADRSKRTGAAYEVILTDGMRYPLKVVLETELRSLELHLRGSMIQHVRGADDVLLVNAHPDVRPIPVIMPIA